MRCFLAIELPDAAREHLARAQDALRAEVPKASFPRGQNLHVTLKFLGDVEDKRLVKLIESMRLVKVSGAIELHAAQIDAFPPRGAARIIVTTMAGSEGPIAALHQAVEQRCRKLGFDAEQRHYHPHVTLARLRPGSASPPRRERLNELTRGCWPGPSFDVQEFVLFESRLHPQGSRYIKLATFAIDG